MSNAVDLTENFGIITEFIHNSINTTLIYIPIIIDQYKSNSTPLVYDKIY